MIVVDDGAAPRRVLPRETRLVSASGVARVRPRGQRGRGRRRTATCCSSSTTTCGWRSRRSGCCARRCCPRDGVFAVAPTIRSPLARCGDEGGKSAVRERRADRDRRSAVDGAASDLLPGRLLLSLPACGLPRSRRLRRRLYAPFFWEDVDLGYRAWRRGLASVHVPDAVCHHEGSATIGLRPISERLDGLVPELGPVPPSQRAGPPASARPASGPGPPTRSSTAVRP